MISIMRLKELDYPEGSILFDVRYCKNPESFDVIYLDPITKQLEVKYEEPVVEIWFLKEENRTNKYQIPQVEIDKCYPVCCKVSQIPKTIAINVGGEYQKFYQENKDSVDRNVLVEYMNR